MCWNTSHLDVGFPEDLPEVATIRQEDVEAGGGRFFVKFTRDEAECGTTENSSAVTTYTIVSGGEHVNIAEAALEVAKLDLAVTIVFLLLCVYFGVNLKRTAKAASLEMVTVSDYSVRVWGLPPRTTKADVRKHFDALFNPTRQSWYTPGYCFGLCWSHRSREPAFVIDRTSRLDGLLCCTPRLTWPKTCRCWCVYSQGRIHCHEDSCRSENGARRGQATQQAVVQATACEGCVPSGTR